MFHWCSSFFQVPFAIIVYLVMHLVLLLSGIMLTVPVARAVQFSSNNPVSGAARLAVETPGDILIGGLFPVHTGHSTTKHCTNLNHERGIHRLEAMMYAVDMINNSSLILYNYTLGVNVRDTCGKDTHALEESVHFIKSDGDSGGQCRSSGLQSAFFGVIGAASSGVSIQVANLLRLFQLPQISYASTSPDLNDRQKYDYFLRTVPPDTYQARAMIDVIRYFKWSSVFGIYSEGNYGLKGMEMFQKLTKTSNICMIASFKVNEKTDFNRIIKEMSEFQDTRVVVLFTSTEDLINLLKAVKMKIESQASEGAKRKYRYRWLASDFWGTRSGFIKDENLEDVAEGAITFTLQTVKVPGFERYFKGLTPEKNKRNPWFGSFWEDYHKCSLSNKSSNGMRHCAGNETLKNSDRLDDKVPYVIDAVHALVYAINDLIARLCRKRDCKLSTLKGKALLDTLQRNLSFTGQLGVLKFDENGSTVREYEINKFVVGRAKGRKSYKYEKIGSWFYKLTEMNATTDVKSSCSDICRIGQIKVPKKVGVTCCFLCRDCGAKQYVEGECIVLNARDIS